MDATAAIGAVGGKWKLSPEELAEVAKLAARDRDVRAHEAAHMAAAAGLSAGGAEYTYQRGPDGKLYAVGGKVNIATTASQSPEEALAKARQLRAAATAPSDPSPQDDAVAAQASQMEQKALQAIAKEKTAGLSKSAAPGHAASGPFRGFNAVA
jgi:hypothetical protein